MREMTINDVDDVLAIELSVQPYPWSKGNLVDAIISGYHAVVEDVTGEICSYAILMQAADEIELLNIAVAEKYQRRGLGKTMLVSQIDRARRLGIQRMFLEVRVSSQAAIVLYRSLGFIELATRRGYYHNAAGTEDAMLMSLNLSEAQHE